MSPWGHMEKIMKTIMVALTFCVRFARTVTRLIAILIFTALVPSARAQAQGLEFPAFYRVTGVAANDVLNLREGPGASFQIVDALAPNADNVEVVGTSPDGRWARVNTPEWSGYAAMRHLQRQPGPPPHVLPLPLTCHGTEPFWDISVAPNGSAQYNETDRGPVSFSMTWSGPAFARGGHEMGMRLVSASGTVHAVLLREYCHDGMTVFDYGLSIRAIISRDEGTYMVEGCCSLR